jgi:hypothetical protein
MQPFERAPRFLFMSNAWNESREGEKTRTTTQARQAVSGLGVRYVLAISLSGALALMALAYFFFGMP